MFISGRYKQLAITTLQRRLLHVEYVSYVELSEDTRFVWQASLLKILFYLLGILVYFFTVERKLLLDSKIEQESRRIQSHLEGDDDGFNFLREKKKLENKSDKLLGK